MSSSWYTSFSRKYLELDTTASLLKILFLLPPSGFLQQGDAPTLHCVSQNSMKFAGEQTVICKHIENMNHSDKPYKGRTDLVKIELNWKKLHDLYSRDEWSSAIVRAATAAEIATNLVVREELQNQKMIDEDFVDHLMTWANGIQGKYQKLILPAIKGKEYEQTFKSLGTKIGNINKERNAIVYTGSFGYQDPAYEIINEAKDVILGFVGNYHPTFQLIEIEK